MANDYYPAASAASCHSSATTLPRSKVHLDKASRFTDWSRRPLSSAQIDYANADVTHSSRRRADASNYLKRKS